MSTPETLAAWTLAAMIESELITIEADSGHSFAGARRPLNDAERTATTRFGDIEAHVATATTRGRPLMRRLLTAGTEMVLNRLFPLGADALAATAAAELIDLAADVATAASDTLAEVLPTIRDTLTGAHRYGATTVIEELSRQGLTVEGWFVPTAPATIDALADNIATHPLIRQLEIASKYVADPFRTLGMTVSRTEITALLGATSDAGSVDVLHQGVQTVLGLGRLDAILANGAERFVRAWSTEILDRNTCVSCATVDGTEYGTLAAAMADYPLGGGHVRCAGGPRCRGLLIFTLRKDGASSSSLVGAG